MVGASRTGGFDVVEAKENNRRCFWLLEKPTSAFMGQGMLGGVPAGCPELVTLFVQGPSSSQLKFVVGIKKASSRNNSDLRSFARWSSLRALQGKDNSNPVSIQ